MRRGKKTHTGGGEKKPLKKTRSFLAAGARELESVNQKHRQRQPNNTLMYPSQAFSPHCRSLYFEISTKIACTSLLIQQKLSEVRMRKKCG